MKKIINTIITNRSVMVQILWICIVAYAIASLNILIHALIIYDKARGAFLDPQTSLVFAIVSFLLVVLISAYHISTLVRRRKRRSDRRKLSRRKAIRAKHNAAQKRVREFVFITQGERYDD
jgi:membrane protein implicated in regulation of membrane protease activity